MKQSFAWWAFANGDIDPETLVTSAKRIGYYGVELMPVDLLPMAVDAGLEIVAHIGHQSIDRGLNDLAQHDRIEREVVDNLGVAGRFGIPNLIVFSGNRTEGISPPAPNNGGVPDREGAEYTARGLRRLAPLAEAAGVNLILELLNSRVNHHGYQCDRTEWGVDVCRMVDSPRVKLLYDIYHMQIMEGDLIRTIQANHSRIGHYHTGGNPGRNDLDVDQEINYPAVFRAIKGTGYNGYIGHEFIPKGDVVPALEAAYKLCADAVA